ncbi:hypothetical protein NO2_1493 [Candidatus Termititenax persephonae]|uniref:Uncharacterized protein n=1 Tax=Candidatus Termititenax persephonae TaxID=2218525 RepID=A0A388TJ73_9BACT|nr:hypothetical protein NO2_1493 [Candidatus Termititenax persephonae]
MSFKIKPLEIGDNHEFDCGGAGLKELVENENRYIPRRDCGFNRPVATQIQINDNFYS